MKRLRTYLTVIVVLSLFIVGCQKPSEQPVVEEKEKIKITFDTLVVSDSANQWFARALADFDKDGLLDVAYIDVAGFGGPLGILKGSKQPYWETKWIAEKAPNEGPFSCGDLEVGDIDNDGDIDILGPQNAGEWTDIPKKHVFYWYEYPDMQPHYIGENRDYIKDVSLVDFNKDNKLDLAGISFDGQLFVLYRQDDPETWTKVQEFHVDNMHEGMDTGDIDGDGNIDIAADGYWFKNPGGDLTGKWEILEIDTIWHNQTGDWSRNATKNFCVDLDKDGRVEVFISHSERAGYPVAYYTLVDVANNKWEKTILIDELPAAHTLQIADMDLDGDMDVLTGVNKHRAMGLEINEFPVYILLNNGDKGWEKQLIDKRGIYNGHVGDFEGDGDLDIFRLETHDGPRYEVLINNIK
ncbi:MAG: VCBS repeat-containing protein [Bacteroidota bacterium]